MIMCLFTKLYKSSQLIDQHLKLTVFPACNVNSNVAIFHESETYKNQCLFY